MNYVTINVIVNNVKHGHFISFNIYMDEDMSCPAGEMQSAAGVLFSIQNCFLSRFSLSLKPHKSQFDLFTQHNGQFQQERSNRPCLSRHLCHCTENY